MSKFLFATWEGGGHAAPALSVAKGLIARGHDVRVLADGVLREQVEAAGAAYVDWTAAPSRRSLDPADDPLRDWEATGPGGGMARARDNLMCGPAARFAADTRAELVRNPADLVVTDLMLLGVGIGAEAAGVPAVALSTMLMSVPGWGVPPAGPGFRPARTPLGRARDAIAERMAARMWSHGLPALNAARTANCLDPLGRAYDQLDRFARILVLSSSAIEYPGFAPPAHVLMTGPRLDDPGWTEPWTPPAGDDPLVLVGLSSSFMDQSAVLRRIADALGRLPVRGVLTTGPAIEPDAIPAPANVQVVRSAPHREVLRHASAVITHAGHGTTAKALASGVPLLCLPLGRDQHDVAARVVHAGAGRALEASAAPSAIARSLRALLERPAYAEHARRVAGVIAGELTEDRAVAALSAAVR